MSTKEKILEAALTLFAENGYNGTSVDEIAKRVGIKAPSLYKHYKGKEEILNVLIESAENRYEESFGSESHIGKIPETKDDFVRINMEKIRFTMLDPMIRKLRIFLVQEQFRNERLARITTKHQLGGLLQMYTKILDSMMQKGTIAKDDPALLAMELTAPVTILISRADREPEYQEEMMEGIEKHLRHFCDIYMRE